MASFPLMSNTAHSRHHRTLIASAAPRKQSFIGQMFLSRNADLDVSPILDEKPLIKNDELSHLKLDKELIAPATDPPSPTSHPTTIGPNSKWTKHNWDIYGDVGRIRCSSAPTVMHGLKGFDHHHAHFVRHPHTPQFQATRNFLQKNSTGMSEVIQNLFNKNTS